MNKCTKFFLVLMGLTINVAQAVEIEFNADSWSTNSIVAGTYESNIPSGWTFESTHTALSILPDKSGIAGIPSLKLGFYNTPAGKTGLLKMGSSIRVPREEIVCDNAIAELDLYVQPVSGKKIDSIQLIATTNEWSNSEIIEIGSPIPIRDNSYKTGWRTFVVSETLQGISSLAKNDENLDFKIGIRAVAGGYSMTYGYLHRMKIDFKARATPGLPMLVDEAGESFSSEILPGVESGRIQVPVSVLPLETVSPLAVFGVIARNNGERILAVTNELEKVGDVYCETLASSQERAKFDAGEIVICSAFTKYKSNDDTIEPFGEIKEDGFAYEFSPEVEYKVGKKGSVWINELCRCDGKFLVELCGTTNRTYLSGWQIVVTDGETIVPKVIEEPFNFATNMVHSEINEGVVGFEVYELDLGEFEGSEAVSIELRNSAGVVEFSVSGVDLSAHYQMNGTAKWSGSFEYDWSETATSDVFSFDMTDEEPTFGMCNIGQEFIVPVSAILRFTTLIDSGTVTNALPYANIIANVAGILNGEAGSTNFIGQTSEDGTVDIVISGYSHDASYVLMTNSVSAFAWRSSDIVTNVSLYGGVIALTNFVSATVAYDDFSELKEYWKNETTIKNSLNNLMYWGVANLTENGVARKILQLDTRNGTKGTATLTSKSYMDLRGKRYFDISFDFRNERNFGVIGDCALVKVIISDTADFSGATIETEELANKSKSYASGEWYNFRQFIEIPEGFAADGKVWIRISATKTIGATSVYVTIDDLRIAAVDSVNVEALNLEKPTGETVLQELPSNVELEFMPLTSGVATNMVDDVVESVTTNILRKASADLMMTINDVEYTLPFKYGDDSEKKDITADVGAVKMSLTPGAIRNATGGFLPGDDVEYYARVSYNPDDADEKGADDIRYFPDNATATDTGWTVRGAYAAKPLAFTVAGPELSWIGDPVVTDSGVTITAHAYDSSKSGVTNVTLTVKCGDEIVGESVFGTNGTYRVTEMLAVEGLEANTEYTFYLTGLNASGNSLASTNFTFATLPEVTKATISAESADSLRLAVEGKAARYDVVPGEWNAASANEWVLNGCVPNTKYYATVTPCNALGATNVMMTATGWTLAAAAGSAPAIEKAITNVLVSAADTMANPNPGYTKYAVKVTTSEGETALMKNAEGVIWKTLDEWKKTPEAAYRPVVNLAATNYFSFVSRNEEGFETHAAEYSQCVFEMTASLDSEKMVQTADPFGVVRFTVDMVDPAESENAELTVEYSLAGGEWKEMFAPVGISFDGIALSKDFEWNARDAVSGNVMMDYALRARVTDGKRVSEWDSASGTLDFKRPGVKLSSATPNPFKAGVPYTVLAAFDETIAGLSASDITVANGKVASVKAGENANTFVIEVNPDADGDVTVSIAADKVADLYGNMNEACAAPVVRQYDATKPVITEIKSLKPNPFGEKDAPLEVAVTFSEKLKDFAPAAVAAENGVVVKTEKGEAENSYVVTVEPETDGTITLSVPDGAVEDLAGNKNEASSVLKTVYDTTKPADLKIAGKPAGGAFSNDSAFAYEASANDLTLVTYNWWIDDASDEIARGTNFEGVVESEGLHTVHVFAVDAVGNVSDTNTVSWTYDFHAPENLAIAGTPVNGEVTRDVAFSFEASSDDLTETKYFWSWKGESESSGGGDEGKIFSGASVEGTNTVSVYAVDAAGNRCEAISHSWVVDTIAPTEPVIGGSPEDGAIVNKGGYRFTATSEDKTRLKYGWALFKEGNEEPVAVADTEVFEGELESDGSADGVYTLKVHAIDEAGNVSPTNSLRWTYDTVKPTVKMTRRTSDPFGLGTPQMIVDVEFSEEVRSFGAANLSAKNAKVSVEEGEEPYSWKVMLTPEQDGEVSVWIASDMVADIAGNGNEASGIVSATYDTEPPKNFRLWGEPEDKVVTKKGQFAFVVFAEDTTHVTYHWTLNDVEWANVVSNYKGTVSEGTNTMVVIAKDALGNPSERIVRQWVVDWTAPTMPEFTGAPENDAIINSYAYNFKAASEDATRLTYHWTMYKNGTDEAIAAEANNGEFAGEVGSSTAADGSYVVKCYAVDEAGNVSMTNTICWIVDTVRPVVSLSSDTPSTFNENKTPLAVTVSISEATDFDAKSLTVVNGEIAGVVEGKEPNTYVVTIDPKDEDEMDGIPFVPVSVEIETDKVSDLAGNKNEASNRLSFRHVTKMPIVSFESSTPQYFNEKASPIRVTATFTRGKKLDPAVVSQFTEKSVLVANGVVSDVSPSFATNVYTFTVVPVAEGMVSIQIPSEVVHDEAGNANEPSETRQWFYDNTSPDSLAIHSPIGEGAVTNNTGYKFMATVKDESPVAYEWTVNGELVEDESETIAGVAIEGTNTVSVCAVDAAGNRCDAISRSWVVDTIAPSEPVIKGSVGDGDITNASGFSFTASAEDATILEYRWDLNGVEADAIGDIFEGVAIEGTNTVSVYAIDEASNKSPVATMYWVLDTMAPEALAIESAIKEGEVTNKVDFKFAATSVDSTTVEYYWQLNDSENIVATNEYAGVAVEGTNSVIVYAVDAAGNRCDAISRSWVVDTIMPSELVIKGSVGDGDITNVSGFSFTASAEDATILEYSWTLTKSGEEMPIDTYTGDSYSGNFKIDGSDDGKYIISVVATDEAGNKSVAKSLSWEFDVTKPAVTLTSETGRYFNREQSPMIVTVAFGEKVREFTAKSLTVANGEVAGIAEGKEPNAYEVSIVPAQDGEVAVSIAADAVLDLAGNGNAATETLTRIYDTVAPEAVLTSETPEYFNSEAAPMVVKVAFSEEMGAFDASAFSVENGMITDIARIEAVAEGEDAEQEVFEYQVTIAPVEDGEVSISIAKDALQDLAGNGIIATEKLSRVYDTVKPAVTLTSETGRYFNREQSPMIVTVAFGEKVREFTAKSLTVANGEVAGIAEGKEPNAYEVLIVPAQDGEVAVSIAADAVLDLAGNGNAATEKLTRIYDTVAPEAVLTSETPEYFNSEAAPMVVKVAFSEEMGVFDASAFSVENGTITDIARIEAVAEGEDAEQEVFEYQVTIAPIEDGEVSISIAKDALQDLAGNGIIATEKLSRVYDTVKPAVTLESDTPDLFNAKDEFIVVAVFSEVVKDFDAGSITVSNGKIVNLAKSAELENTYSFKIEPEHDGEVAVQIADDKIFDRAGNGNVASAVLTRECDITPPEVVLTTIVDPTKWSTDEFIVQGEDWVVKAVFSEKIRSFDAENVVCGNCRVVSVEESEDEENAYYITVSAGKDGEMSVIVEEGAVADIAGNGVMQSDELSIMADNDGPTKPVITAVWDYSSRTYTLTASSSDSGSGVYEYVWEVDRIETQGEGDAWSKLSNVPAGAKVKVYAIDWNYNSSYSSSWTASEEPPQQVDVDFGGGVKLAIDPATGETNSISIVKAEFRPGAESTLTFAGFSADKEEISELKMWIVTSEELVGADNKQERVNLQVDAKANYNATTGELTVRIPMEATMGKKSMFIYGISNEQ